MDKNTFSSFPNLTLLEIQRRKLRLAYLYNCNIINSEANYIREWQKFRKANLGIGLEDFMQINLR